MPKQYGNPGVNAPRDSEDHPQSSPSNSVVRDSPPTTSSYPSDRMTHVHHSPKGETGYAGQYRAPDDTGSRSGPKLNRAVERQGPYGDNASRAGRIGSGFEGGDQRYNRMGDDVGHGSPLAEAMLRGEDPWSRD